MLDHLIRPIINPTLLKSAKIINTYHIHPNLLTAIGFSFGLLSMLFIYIHNFNAAIICILLNRLFDGLDGPVAQEYTKTLNNIQHSTRSYNNDFGGFLDIICDFIIYAGVIFAFGMSDYQTHNIYYSCVLIFSFIGTITSFLAYAIIAAKYNIQTEKRGKKSFYHSGGICEGTETFIVLIAICYLPDYFNIISLIFSLLCWLTTIQRVYRAYNIKL